MPTLTATDTDFDEIIANAETPILVDFWATWCGPCKAIAPILEEISGELDGQASILKMDVDQSPATAARFGIRGVPTLILFNKGEVVATHVGPGPKGKLLAFIKQAL